MIFTNNLSPVLLDFGFLEIRWYGLMYAIGLIFVYFYTYWIFKREKYPVSDLDGLAVYLFIGMVIGARLGHVFFYEAEYYLSHPIDILKVWNGGLASHGGAIGVFLAYLIWTKVYKVKFSKYPDCLVLGIPVLAALIRIGNFFNSEIVGLPTKASWGVIFKRLGEDFPRHPVQFYEAFLSLFIFVVMFVLYKQYYKRTKPLFFLFLYIFLYFSGRFGIEFFKDLQGPLENLPITMGQLLSVLPVVLALVYFLAFYRKMDERMHIPDVKKR